MASEKNLRMKESEPRFNSAQSRRAEAARQRRLCSELSLQLEGLNLAHRYDHDGTRRDWHPGGDVVAVAIATPPELSVRLWTGNFKLNLER